MSQAARDQNFVTTLLGASSADNTTPVKVWADPVTHRLLVDNGGGGTPLSVTDGITTVSNVATIDFTSGATVSDGGGGVADVAISGGGAPGGSNKDIQFNDTGSFGGVSTLTFDKATNIVTLGVENDIAKVLGATATTSNTDGGSLDVYAGNGLGSGFGGTLDLEGGTGGVTGTGGDVDIIAGFGGSTSGNGGIVFISGGFPNESTGIGAGGTVQIESGASSNDSAGAEILIAAGDGTVNGTGNGNGGPVTIKAGFAGLVAKKGGPVNITGGGGNGTSSTSAGGDVNISGGPGGNTSGDGGQVNIVSGSGIAGTSSSGDLTIQTGNGHGAGNAANLSVLGGEGGATGNGGEVLIEGGNGGATSGNGGLVLLAGGAAQLGTSNGGDVQLYPGAKSGAGTVGHIRFIDPTSVINAVFDTSLLATSNKTFTFPNNSGTLALTSDITAAALTIGSTVINSGTSTRILYDNAGTLGEYTLTGSGTVAVMQSSPSLITPALGVATATSLAIGGATIGTNGLAVTGHLLLEGVTSTGATGTGSLVFGTAPTFTTSATVPLVIGGSGTTGTQLTLKTTTGNGTTDALAIVGGNNGGTTFATFTTGALTIGTSGVFTTGTIELGAATDTTLSRSGAGVLAVEGVVIPSISSTNTLTNKRVTPRVLSAAAYTTDTGSSLNGDTQDMFIVTAQTGALKFNNPTGTPTDGQKLIITVASSTTAARALTWDTAFGSTTVTLPTTTTATTATLSIGFIWSASKSLWQCVAVA